MRVFISHSSKDKPAVEKLALALHERGIDPWLDKWEIGPGDDIVASINAGLERAAAGIIVFTRHSGESRWVEAETSYLTYARIQESKPLIPVVLGEDAYIPPLLRPLARRGIEEVEAIADALRGRKGGPPPRIAPEQGLRETVLISLSRREEVDQGAGIGVEVWSGGLLLGEASLSTLPSSLFAAQQAFREGTRAGTRRSPAVAARASMESTLTRLGHELLSLCLPGSSGDAVAELLEGSPIGTLVEIVVEADDPDLFGFPFEALRLPDGRLLATHSKVTMLRRPTGVTAYSGPPMAGPLKILVAVGAPDEGETTAAVLDQERELQNILDAVQPAGRLDNAEVRILEVGHPEVIAGALAADAYHVLHLSCHGRPGVLQLDDEEGRAVPTTAEELTAALQPEGRPIPLVLLNACHGGVQEETAAMSFAEALLRAGIPAVLAMQTSVSDRYATVLALSFYRHLAAGEHLRPSRALAAARKELERQRQAAVAHGGALEETQPEYATAALLVAGEERPLADFGLDKVRLKTRPVYQVAGPVPQLRIDDLIGRRRILRECLRGLREAAGGRAGVVLTGIGGVGKSAVAGRVMTRLREEGWMVPAHKGRWDLAEVAVAVGTALADGGDERRANLLNRPDLDDRIRLQLIAQTLAEERIVLVLDDFEKNLETGGGAYLDAGVQEVIEALLASARTGRLLITSRHPVPGSEAFLERIPVGPLSPAETRKLTLRLAGFQELQPEELVKVLRSLGGHPRVLELVDALLQGGTGRLPHVTSKLQDLLVAHQVDPTAQVDQLDEAIQVALQLGARDVLLEELLALARREETAETPAAGRGLESPGLRLWTGTDVEQRSQ